MEDATYERLGALAGGMDAQTPLLAEAQYNRFLIEKEISRRSNAMPRVSYIVPQLQQGDAKKYIVNV